MTIHSVFDSDSRRIAEYNETSGQLLREYVWNGWEPVAVIEGGTVYFIRADHIGLPVFATNASGVTVWSATYQPFGGVHVSTGNLPENRFPGQWFQSESGLHQNWMRDYDPTTGRYLQADPLGLVDGASVYGYALQNPLADIDPTGLQTEGSSAGLPRPNRFTLNCLPECEKHHPIPSAYLPLIDGKKPRQGRVDMSTPDHRALHADLNKWMTENCTKCLIGGAMAHAGFSSINGGYVIRDNFPLNEIISCLEEYWNSGGGWRKGKWPNVYTTYRTTVAIWKGKGIL